MLSLWAHDPAHLTAVLDDSGEQVQVFRRSQAAPILTQVAKPDFRPYVHPIIAPDGKGQLTEFSPDHHKHQTGLYWGITRVNGRDYFHHPGNQYWQRVGVTVLKAEADHDDPTVSWRTVYDMLDADGNAVMRETQVWTMRDQGDHYLIDLNWQGAANTNVTLDKHPYGGLFLRMPWREGDNARVFNSARQSDSRSEGQRAVWLDVGIQVPGRDDQAHIAILDHPKNKGFPLAWRVDPQFGVGTALTRSSERRIDVGESLSMRHRLIVHTGDLDDVWLTRQWNEYSGQRMAWSQWKLAQREGREAEFLTPEKAVERMTVKKGFRANVFAAEPMITQPMAFCWDDRGRLWIAENRDYETRQTGFSADGQSRILILEDSDRDGVADSRKVFLEGIPFPAAIAVGMGGLWLGAPPNLLFVPDRDGDDHADDDDIQVRLTGWGIRDRHETLNSLIWGPDGWLYGCQGFATPSQVGKPAGGGQIYRRGESFPERFEFADQPVDINGGVWRYHPSKDRFEVVAHGFSNPWGIDYDSRGQLFMTACVIPHLWHVIPGGIYHRQGGQHYNPHVYSDIKTIADHRHRSAHGGARVYLSDALPDKYRQRIFMANIHEHAVLTDILEPSGSGFIGRHGDEFALANNAQWIGFSVEIGPDGNIYVLDWHDADICGKEVLQKETGRVFRFAPNESLADDFPHRYDDIAQLKDIELVRFQKVESAWHARRARLALQHRATLGPIDGAAISALQHMLRSSKSPPIRLRALWAMHVTGIIESSRLQELLGDADEHVRAWAVQLLCEDRLLDFETAQRLVEMSANDHSPVVRLYLASAAQRIDRDMAWLLLRKLSLREEDAEDHNLPKMIWFGLEPLVMSQIPAALELAAEARIPLISRYICRRIASEDQLELLVKAIGECDDTDRRLQMLLGMRDALEGRFDLKSPGGWGDLYRRLRAGGGQPAQIALQLSGQFGDRVATEAMLTTLTNPAASRADRLQALTGLAGRQSEQLIPRLVDLLDDGAFRRDALRAAAAFDDPELAQQILRRYPRFSAADKIEAITTLASRSSYANRLTDALLQGEISKTDIPAYVARTMRRIVGNRFIDVWGPLDRSEEKQEQQFARYRQLITSEALERANPAAGRLVFDRTCAACHKLHGYGGTVGPDITGANRSNLEYLLGNILTPSAIIQDAYKMQIVLTDDGRIYSGIPTAENDRQLMLHVADRNQPTVIAKSKIESRETAPISMMPTGTLDNLTDQEVIDLIKYVQSDRQISLP